MATVQQTREGIRDRLATIAGLRPYAVMPEDINAPAAVVYRRTTEFDTSTDSDDLTMAVTLFVEWTNTRTAQEALDAYTAGEGASSVRRAIDGDPTLGGAVDWCRVASVEADRITEWAGRKYLSADVVIEVG